MMAAISDTFQIDDNHLLVGPESTAEYLELNGRLCADGQNDVGAAVFDLLLSQESEDARSDDKPAFPVKDDSATALNSSVQTESINVTYVDVHADIEAPAPGQVNFQTLLTPVNSDNVLADQVTGRSVQLEDGTTAFVESVAQDGLHAVHVEDGTVAYITSDAHTQLFTEIPVNDIEKVKTEAKLSCDVDRFEKDGKYKCPSSGCGKLYTTRDHLKVHSRSHSGEKPFICPYAPCRKGFVSSGMMKAHTRTHTGEKPYACTYNGCGKSFRTSGDLLKHSRTHTGERPYECPFEGCHRTFTTANIRKVHIRTHTGEKPYVCNVEICGRQFASLTNYNNHMRIHSGDKPYVCPVSDCNRRFTEYSSLYKHQVVHTLAKPYTCNICHRSYRQTSTLSMHVRTAHPETLIKSNPPHLNQGQFTIENCALQMVTNNDGLPFVDGNQSQETSILRPGIQFTPVAVNISQIANEGQLMGQLYLLTDSV